MRSRPRGGLPRASTGPRTSTVSRATLVVAPPFVVKATWHEMLRDFLPTNPGMSRRFPYRVWLSDYSLHGVSAHSRNATALPVVRPAETIAAWTVDPVVAYPDGGKGSVFDALEDMDAAECVEAVCALVKAQ